MKRNPRDLVIFFIYLLKEAVFLINVHEQGEMCKKVVLLAQYLQKFTCAFAKFAIVHNIICYVTEGVPKNQHFIKSFMQPVWY